MGELINLQNIKDIAGGNEYHCLTCQKCGGQVWCNLYCKEDIEEGFDVISVMACAGFMEDGTKCENVIDLNDIDYEY